MRFLFCYVIVFVAINATYEHALGDILCPDNETTCKPLETCCTTPDGYYGCCLLPEAICCTDKIHCCPKKYTCNPDKGRCDRRMGDALIDSVEWLEKRMPQKRQIKAVQCPDGKSQCPDGNTCCQLATGQWGCCPLAQAVCCDDHQHCCPSGYKCDTKDGRCLKGELSIPFYNKIEAIKTEVQVVPCPDGKSQCPDGNTCCQLSTGQWGCCPLPQAVCCDDHQHCCPSGYKCDTKDGRCLKGELSIPFFNKIEATKLEAVQCPDGKSQCPDGNTCCQLATGQWGCCPLAQAVCCDDHQHCCPSGYKCDTKDGRCLKGELSIPFFVKINAIVKN